MLRLKGMGVAASKKRKRRQDEAPPEPIPSGPALEELAVAPFVPPKAVTLLLVAAALGGVAYFGAQGLQAAKSGEGKLAGTLLRVQARNERPEAFELSNLQGEKVSLASLKGKVVFVNFWATWCPPCVEEMPSMRRLREKFADDDRFVMLAISADEGWEPVRKFFATDKPPFPVLLDANGALAKKYGTEKFPETYVIIDGKLVGYIVGPRDWDAWYAEAYLRALLPPSRASS